MTEQLVLFGEPELPPRFASFVRFHRANPVIYQKFVEFALEAVRAGREHFGARMIGERVRWYVFVDTVGDGYKINDHHWPYYSRLSMLEYPQLLGVFETRTATSDATDAMILRHCRTR